MQFDPTPLPVPAPDEKPGQSDAQILQQLEAELDARPASQSPAVVVAFALSCVACVGVFGMMLKRAHPPAPPVASALAAAPIPTSAPAPAWVSWTFNFEDGQNLARASGKKMVVAFYADWCPSCRWMDSSVYSRPEVQGEAASFEMVKVNSDARPDLAKRYNIRVLPSFVWMNAGGDEIGRHDGFLPAPEFAQWLRNNR